MRNLRISLALALVTGIALLSSACTTTKDQSASKNPSVKFVVTDAMQTKCYDNEGNVIDPPETGELYYGQDAQYQGILPSYTDNGDGTVTDNNTGLMWQQTPPADKIFILKPWSMLNTWISVDTQTSAYLQLRNLFP